jgi:hypothetical protein
VDLQELFDNASEKMRSDSLKNSPQWTIGELIIALEAVDKTFPVKFSDGTIPSELTSWRGSYREIAFTYEADGIPPTVEKVLSELKGAIGKTYEGYKGGDFVMGRRTPVWVAEWGTSGDTGVVGVEIANGICFIRLAVCDF